MNAMDYIAAAPEMTLLGLICVVLIADLFVSDEKRVATFWMSMISLAITLWVLLATAPADSTVVFYGAYVTDALSQAMKIAVVGAVAVVFLYARDYLRANDIHKVVEAYYTTGAYNIFVKLMCKSIEPHQWLAICADRQAASH